VRSCRLVVTLLFASTLLSIGVLMLSPFKAEICDKGAAETLNRPDGLAFSPDEKTLYIVEDGSTPPAIRAYDVAADGTRLTNGRVFIRAEKGGGDGLRVDVDGNLWCGWAGGEGLDGVMVFNKGGELIGRIDLPERCANVCFGGYRRSRLFMVASRSLYALWVGTSGALGG
jgi:gluconolactonase